MPQAARYQVHSLAPLAISFPFARRTCASLLLDDHYFSDNVDRMESFQDAFDDRMESFQEAFDDRLESFRGAFRSRRFRPDSLGRDNQTSADGKENPVPADSSLLSSASLEVAINQVTFGELLTFLDVEYGLAPQYVQQNLLELAEILGYSDIDMQTPLNLADAGMLMEEVGAPACTADELVRFQESRKTETAAVSKEEVSEEAPDEAPSKPEDDGQASIFEMLKAGRSHIDQVYVSYGPKFRSW
jgi:hypothetical protein